MSFTKNTYLLPRNCRIHFATADQVMGYIKGQQDANAIFPVLNGLWQDLYFTLGSAELTETQEKTKHGSRYSYNLTLKYPGLDPQDPHAFAALDHHKWILLLEFSNGTKRLIGNPWIGSDFSWSFSTTASGFQLEWNLTDSRAAYNYEAFVQFFINEDQHLIQTYPDANTYTVDADKHFIMDGPQSPDYTIDEGHLINPQ